MIVSDSFWIFVLRVPGGSPRLLVACMDSACTNPFEWAPESDEIGTFGLTIIDALNGLSSGQLTKEPHHKWTTYQSTYALPSLKKTNKQ